MTMEALARDTWISDLASDTDVEDVFFFDDAPTERQMWVASVIAELEIG